VASAAALHAFQAERESADGALRALCDQIRIRVPATVPDAVVHGDPVRRLPHIVTFSCLYVDGEALVTELDRAGFSVSSGSSCASDTHQPSHVLAAMRVLTHGNVRVSLPRGAQQKSVGGFLSVLPGVVARLRDTVGAYGDAPRPEDPYVEVTA
jgi:cysteine desulfurase